MARLTVESCAAKLRELSGNVAAVARAFDVTRSSVYSFVDDHPELKAVLQEARETMKDNVESRLYADCLKDDPSYQTSRIFFLKTQAKDRGYVERSEVTGKDGKDLLNVTDDDLDKQISAAQAAVAGTAQGEAPADGSQGADPPAVVPVADGDAPER